MLEHIRDDREELNRASARLAPDGVIVALAPACQCLYSAFDRHIGHWRRYTARRLRDATPASLALDRTSDLDTAGLLASLGNRLVLSQPLPTLRQVMFWDRWLVPVSRVIDPLIGHRAGRSVIAVWRPATPAPPAPSTVTVPGE